MAVMDMFKVAGHWLFMQVLGGVQAIKEQTIDRHKSLKNDVLSLDGSGKTIVLTGGNRGIGWEAAKVILPLGYRIIFGVRDATKMEKELQTLKDSDKLGSGSYEVHKLNLKSLRSVEAFGRKIRHSGVKVNILINNAGIMFPPREETLEGYESQFGVNHLSHVLLTHILLDNLKAASTPDFKSRIVNVSSVAHTNGMFINFDDLQCRKFYSPEMAYGNSKAAQILFTQFLKKNILPSDSVTVSAIHPGVVRTELHSKFFQALGALVFKNAFQGGETIVYAALSPEIEGDSGMYLDNSTAADPCAFCLDDENQKKLWDYCNKELGIDNFGDGKVSSDVMQKWAQ